jgi:hypothetical protein
LKLPRVSSATTATLTQATRQMFPTSKAMAVTSVAEARTVTGERKKRMTPRDRSRITVKKTAKKRSTRKELLDEKFTKLAEDAVGESEAVRCDLTEYIAGLETMRDYIEARIEGCKQELAQGASR